MRGGIHDTFDPITIHTAKCDICNKHNTSTMFRCTKCGRQCCTPCWDGKGGNGIHNLHNKKTLEYTGPKAAPLPAPEPPKSPAVPPIGRAAGRKRGRYQTATVADGGASRASPAASATDTASAGEAEDSTSKRRRHDSVEASGANTTSTRGVVPTDAKRHRHSSVDSPVASKDHKEAKDNEEAGKKATKLIDNPWYLPPIPPKSSKAKQASTEEGSSKDAKHTTPAKATTVTTHEERNKENKHSPSDKPNLSRDHNGLNAIFEAAELLERHSASSTSDDTSPAPAVKEINPS
ncbi:MAG: hypothetical protein Q9218_005799, partial [Villophora microphyllina]